MRQCVKPAKIGHALKWRPCWERQTRLIPSVFYMLPFLHIFKLKTIRGHCFRWTTFFSPQIKKSPYATFKILGISEKQRIKLNIFVNFFKKKHFFWRSVKYLQKNALRNQGTLSTVDILTSDKFVLKNPNNFEINRLDQVSSKWIVSASILCFAHEFFFILVSLETLSSINTFLK